MIGWLQVAALERERDASIIARDELTKDIEAFDRVIEAARLRLQDTSKLQKRPGAEEHLAAVAEKVIAKKPRRKMPANFRKHVSAGVKAYWKRKRAERQKHTGVVPKKTGIGTGRKDSPERIAKRVATRKRNKQIELELRDAAVA